MQISEMSIRRSVTTTMMYALVILLGIVAVFKLPLEFMPSIEAPFLEVMVPYEGASPVEVCDRIAEPIEEAIATMPGIDKLRSRCRQGFVYIGIELDPATKMDYMVLDIQERIDQIRDELPADVRNVWINKFDTEQFPIVFGAVTFPEHRPENNDLIEKHIVRSLKTVDGIADVRVEGLEHERVLVEINQDKLTNYGISIIQVYNAVWESSRTSRKSGTCPSTTLSR